LADLAETALNMRLKCNC